LKFSVPSPLLRRHPVPSSHEGFVDSVSEHSLEGCHGSPLPPGSGDRSKSTTVFWLASLTFFPYWSPSCPFFYPVFFITALFSFPCSSSPGAWALVQGGQSFPCLVKGQVLGRFPLFGCPLVSVPLGSPKFLSRFPRWLVNPSRLEPAPFQVASPVDFPSNPLSSSFFFFASRFASPF